MELEKSPKICPSCGSRKYIADILANVVTCLNDECENYGQELKEEIEECSICGEKTGKLAFRFNPKAKVPVIVISILAAAYFSLLYWFEEAGTADGFDLIRNMVFAIIIGVGFFSRSKAALITSIISLIFTIAVSVLAAQQ